MRKLELLAATAALAVATPILAQGRRDRDDFYRVPPGQMPPAGMCRIWIDGVPPGRQPAPMNCSVAARRLPANAHLIYGPGVYANNGYYNDRVYQDEIARQRELQIERERELQIARERELQIARDREWQREQQMRAREIDAQRLREQAIRQQGIRDRNRSQDRDHDGDRDHRWNGNSGTSSNDHRDFRRGSGR